MITAKFHNISRKHMLAPEIVSIWDSISLGVIIVDAGGSCVYMNSIQKTIDGLDNETVIGKHISHFYTPYAFATLPTLQCLGTGKPMLKKTYWYKTTTNKMINAINDIIPLFDNGKIDGAITFSSIYGLSSMTAPPDGPPAPPAKHEELQLYSFDSIVGSAPLLRKGIETARAASRTSSHVMIWGESGSGKELFAQSIHVEGKRGGKPFIPINCAAIPENLLEGFMFGTVKGAFTDATDRAGLFENANGGTLMLDEINSMPLGLQAKLLRAIQENKIRRVGSQKEIAIDVRIISTLNEHPLKAVEKGILRKDLYYRLAVVGISVPPLRERKEDVLYLADYFINASKLDQSFTGVRLSDAVRSMFISYNWPGNIRELQNVIEGSLIMLGDDNTIYPEHLPQQFIESYTDQSPSESAMLHAPVDFEPIRPGYQKLQYPYYDYADVESNASPTALKSCLLDYERNCVRNVLRFTGGNVAKAARILQMKPAALHYRLDLLGLNQ